MSALTDAQLVETTLLTARDQINAVVVETVEGPKNNALSVQRRIHQGLHEIAEVIAGLGGAPSVAD